VQPHLPISEKNAEKRNHGNKNSVFFDNHGTPIPQESQRVMRQMEPIYISITKLHNKAMMTNVE